MAGRSPRSAEVATAGSGDSPYRPIPARTRSRRAAGCHSRPAVAARWRTSTSSPASARTRSAASRRRRCVCVEPQAGSSARERWLHRPTTTTSPASWAIRAAPAKAGRSAATAPARDMPVSALMWTRAAPPSARAAADTASSPAGVETETSIPAARAARRGEPGAAAWSGLSTGRIQVRRRGAREVGADLPASGRGTPAWSSSSRRRSASESWATPSQVAPAPRQARATGPSPWP